MRQLSGRIVTPAGIVEGRIGFGPTIEVIEATAGPIDEVWIVPGFIDLHVHGGGGADCMEGEDAVREMARFHARHGTTTLLPTTMTDRPECIGEALAAIARVLADPDAGSASILGAHLEGPFINPAALGAQPPCALAPDPALFARWLSMVPIRVATVAPEIDEAGLLLELGTRHGTRVQIGHSCATCAQAAAALDMGYAGFTHLFNAMTGLHHRRPGIVGCALAHGRHAEIIPDLIHVAAPALQAALRAIPELYAVTDATAAAGMPDGRYRLGRQDVIKTGERVLMADGETIAGSALCMDRAFANLHGLGLDMVAASRRCSTIQADYLGLADRGRIQLGCRADLVVLDSELVVRAVFVEGREIAGVP